MNTPMYQTMMTMFEHAVSRMELETLEELAEMSERAGDEAARLASVCSALADAADTDSGVARLDGVMGVATLLEVLAHSFDTISGMVYVGDNAAFHAAKLRDQSSGSAPSSLE